MHPLYATLPLDHSRRSIRLWRFHQDAEGNDLRLELLVRTLDSAPDYMALSYVWGVQTDDWRHIHVNESPLLVTPNLHDFLEVLSHNARYNRLWFWADQISMDQSNIAERNHQVQMMSEIFSTALLVFAWLGPEPEDPQCKVSSLAGASPLVGNKLQAEQVVACDHLFRQDYWNRLWIVQELRLAQSVLFWCGPHTIRRGTLFRSCWMFSKWQADLFEYEASTNSLLEPMAATFMVSASSIMSLLSSRHGTDWKQSLADVLRSFSSHECTEPRDKILGLQALVVEEQRVPTDYARSMEHLVLTSLMIMIPRLVVHDCSTAGHWHLDILIELVRRLCRHNGMADTVEMLCWGSWAYNACKTSSSGTPEERYHDGSEEWPSKQGSASSTFPPSQDQCLHQHTWYLRPELAITPRQHRATTALQSLWTARQERQKQEREEEARRRQEAKVGEEEEEEEEEEARMDARERRLWPLRRLERIVPGSSQVPILASPMTISDGGGSEPREEDSGDSIVRTVLSEHGFVMYGAFLSHPEDWPFPDDKPRGIHEMF